MRTISIPFRSLERVRRTCPVVAGLIGSLIIMTRLVAAEDTTASTPAAPADQPAPAALPADPAQPRVRVDLGREVGTVNPFIFGQFIEHLGRCIYGGIWAEMLEDRKFFQAPASVHSPWQRLGGEIGWSLTFDVGRPYVGSGSMKIAVTDRAEPELHGLRQRGLGVVGGRDYVGYVVLAGRGTVKVRLAWGDQLSQCDTATIQLNQEQFGRYPLRFRAGESTDNAALLIGLESRGAIWVGTASLMPADHLQGLRADTLAVLRDLDAPVYRWPGGNFVSGYDWRDGIGPRDRRPPRKNPAWQGIEPNDFGIDEFVAFCRTLGTEPLVVVNTGLGSPELAANLVQYCNGSTKTTWGRQRAAHGHPEPYGVKWWGVGNEMYGDWQLGHIPLEAYLLRHQEFVRAMRAVDPTIKLIAVGATGPWSEQMLTRGADAMDLLSEHFYCGENTNLQAHVAAIPDQVRAKVQAHRRYLETIPALKNRFIPLAIDEWNYWYGPHHYGELGVRYTLRDALGIARGLHEMVRHHDVVQMANYAQTVNVIGAVKTSKTAAAFDTTGLPLKLYRRQFGPRVLRLYGEPSPLDVAVALTADRSHATLAAVNPTTNPLTLNLEVTGGELGASARQFRISGDSPLAYNEPGKPMAVAIQETAETNFTASNIVVAPFSVNLWVAPVTR